MRIYRLDKVVFSLGPAPEDLLQGITSNTLDAPSNALLTAQGKIIATCEQQRVSDDEVVLLVAGCAAPTVRELFGKYAVFTQTVCRELDQRVYYDLDGKVDSESVGEKVMIFEQAAGRIVVGGALESRVEEEAFRAFRVEQGMPFQGVDYADEMLLNVFGEGYVSYTKGCFVGQEVIARVHNLSKPPRKLVVRYEDKCNEDERGRMTSKVAEAATGCVHGFVFVNNK